MLSNNEPYPVRAICRVLDLPRSTYYHRPKESDDLRLREAIEAIVQEFPTYGSRRVTKQLRRSPYNIRVNRKRIQRLLWEMGLQQPQKRLTCRTTNSCHAYPRYPNLVKELSITFPDQVWVSDITYIRLQREFIYLAVIMDVFTRSIRGWQLSRSLDQQLTLTALKRALSDHVPLIHHSDQGGQYAATAYTDLLTSHGVQISMAAEGVPEENGHAERLLRTIKEEEVKLSEYYDFEDALTQIGYFIEQVYQSKRIHSALGYLTPAEFEAAWHRTQIEKESLKPV
jgi:putative transposase